MTQNDRIEINATVMGGKPIILGTRIPVEILLRKLAEGATAPDLLDAQAALGHAADTLAHEERVILSGPGEK